MSFNLYAQTVPATLVRNTKIDEAWVFSDRKDIRAHSWQEACVTRKWTPADQVGWCLDETGKFVQLFEVDVCSDGSITKVRGECELTMPACPSSEWVLSKDKKTCTRADRSCNKD